MIDRQTVIQILDVARWAPSGDNTQPWRFQIVDDSNVVVHGFDTRDHCVYDLDGHPSQISIGALLETISIAATAHGLRTDVARRIDGADARPTFNLHFVPDASVRPDPLLPQIPLRSVQRRPMRLRRLTDAEKQTLESALGPSHRIIWIEGWARKLETARLMFANAKLRLTMPEAYLVHRDVIQWGARYSPDRVPDQALGADPMMTRLMRWIMKDWRRVAFVNRNLAGSVAPRIQMDWLPSLFCAGHFLIVADRPAQSIDNYVKAGRAVQRFWLMLTGLGLVMQSEMTPLIFGRYARDELRFSQTAGMQEQALRLARKLDALLGEKTSALCVFMGRVGAGSQASARSTRRELEQLLVTREP